MDRSNDIEFDGWTLNRNSGELRKSGRSIRLRPQPLKVLEELLAHRGEVVSRAHLIARLWPKGVVDFDTALNSAVRRLRRALCDDADTPKYIETIPRKGYRFIGAVIPPQHESMPADKPAYPAHARPHAAHYPGALRAAPAVLLFSAVFALVAAGDSSERRPTKNFTSSSLSAPALASAPASSNPSISEGLKKARYFLERRSRGDLEFARGHFEQVLGLDPTRADAYAGLASVYWMKTVEGAIPREVGLPKVSAFAERALSLDLNNVEALQRLALYNRASGNRAKSDAYFRRALELNPDDALLLGIQASTAFAEERLDESVQLARRAVAAAPLNLVSRYNLASTLYMTGHFDEALKVMQELLQFDSSYRADVMAYILILNGRHQAALELAQSWVDGPDKSQTLALAHFGLGNIQEADQALATLIAQVRDTEPLRVAEVYAYRRALDEAFDWLRAGTQPSNGGAITPPGLLQSMKYSPFIAPLRVDPRWEQWVASVHATG
jgi:DNA-binding winged helix-turn-helix (wHTH) protein/tetratricopeptide (TPR) repeat protein